jgi:hypothetical protein
MEFALVDGSFDRAEREREREREKAREANLQLQYAPLATPAASDAI